MKRVAKLGEGERGEAEWRIAGSCVSGASVTRSSCNTCLEIRTEHLRTVGSVTGLRDVMWRSAVFSLVWFTSIAAWEALYFKDDDEHTSPYRVDRRDSRRQIYANLQQLVQ